VHVGIDRDDRKGRGPTAYILPFDAGQATLSGSAPITDDWASAKDEDEGIANAAAPARRPWRLLHQATVPVKGCPYTNPVEQVHGTS